MGTLIYSYLASLDGYIADEQGEFGWAQPDEEVLDFLNRVESSITTYLYGRRIYELMTGWETDPDFAAQSEQSAVFAGLWQRADKIVFSRTLDRDRVTTARTRIERRFDAETVAAIRSGADGDLAVSGAELAASAWRLGLIDEVQLFVAPVLVGGGKPLFPPELRQALDLRGQHRFGNGMVFLRYAVRR